MTFEYQHLYMYGTQLFLVLEKNISSLLLFYTVSKTIIQKSKKPKKHWAGILKNQFKKKNRFFPNRPLNDGFRYFFKMQRSESLLLFFDPAWKTPVPEKKKSPTLPLIVTLLTVTGSFIT